MAGPASGDVLWTRDLVGNPRALHVVRERSSSLVAADHGSKGIRVAQASDSKSDVYFGTWGKHICGFGPHGTKLFDVTAAAPIDSYPPRRGAATSSSATRQGRWPHRMTR